MEKEPNIHLIVGEDDYLVESAAKRILEAAVPADLRATAVEVVNGDAGNMELQLASIRDCTGSVQTPPFLDPVKLTWWRGVTFLPGGGVGGKLSEDVKDALEKFAENLTAHPLPDNQVLLITAKKLLMSSIFAKRLKTCANVIEFAGGGKAKDQLEEALLRLPGLAEDEKLTFDPGADQAFLAKVGTDTRTIVSELQKLRTYLGDERNNVTRADVDTVSSVSSQEPEIWEITDAAAKRNPALMIKVLSKIEKDGYGILVTTVMEKFFREALLCRDALDHGWLDKWGRWSDKMSPDVRKTLDATGFGPGTAKSPWMVKRACQNASAFTANELRIARFRMLQAREKLVSSNAGDEFAVTELLRCVTPAAPRRK